MKGGASPPGESSTASTSSVTLKPHRNPRASGACRLPVSNSSHAGRRLLLITHPRALYSPSSSHSERSLEAPANSLSPSKAKHLPMHVRLSVKSVSRKKHHAAQTQWKVNVTHTSCHNSPVTPHSSRNRCRSGVDAHSRLTTRKVPCRPPQIMNDQQAPCHSPPSVMVIIKFRQVRQPPWRLPPRGT